MRGAEARSAAPSTHLSKMHHLVASAEKVHRVADGWETRFEASSRGIFAAEDLVAHGRKRGEHLAPTCSERFAQHGLGWVPAVLRDAWCAVLEVFVREWKRDLEVRATDHLEHAIRINREMPNAKRRMVGVRSRLFAEALGGNRLGEIIGIAHRKAQAARHDVAHGVAC